MPNHTKIIHLSVVHFPYDPRVVYRESFSLSKRFKVSVIIPNADASLNPDIDFVSLPFFSQTWLRILFVHPIAFWHCLRIWPSVIHIHDAELLPLAFLMRLLGVKIIYDVHENLRKQWAVKKFNTGFLLQRLFDFFDKLARKHFYLIFAEKSYLNYYQDLSLPSQVVYNYPSLDFFERHFQNRIFPPQGQPHEFFYVGQISLARGMDTLINALYLVHQKHPNFVLHLVGGFEFDLENVSSLERIDGFEAVKDRIKFYGKIDPREAFKLSERALVGIALLKNQGDSCGSYPTKMFEYMALGIPVITSDFELYQEVVDSHDCGFCIDATDSQALADALIYYIENPKDAYMMGINGRLAAQNYYNWQSEEDKLFDFYETVLGNQIPKQPVALELDFYLQQM